MSDDWRDDPRKVGLVDVALLAVIRAHSGSENDTKRLNDAKHALFSIARPKGRPHVKDTPELAYMAERYVEKFGRPEIDFDSNGLFSVAFAEVKDKKPVAVTALALEAINRRRKEEGRPQIRKDDRDREDDVIRNLAEKFTAQKERLLLAHASWGRGTFNGLARAHLDDLRALLEILSIPLVLPKEPDRDINPPT
jgi:hypothetical protein